jgi:toxin ParE1/3/4
MSSVRWSAEARADLARIDDYHFSSDHEFADHALRQAFASGHKLAQNPYMGPLTDNGIDRKWPVRKTPYILLYRLMDNGVWIARVVHAASDWASLI